MPVRLKRAYEPAEPSDGRRYLIDRLWPRGLTAEALRLTAWRKDLAPSDDLRRNYCHDPAKFPRFRDLYREELRDRGAELDELREQSRRGVVTLVFGARDVEHSNAAVLGELLRQVGVRGRDHDRSSVPSRRTVAGESRTPSRRRRPRLT